MSEPDKKEEHGCRHEWEEAGRAFLSRPPLLTTSVELRCVMCGDIKEVILQGRHVKS